jgi:hypothetical protein
VTLGNARHELALVSRAEPVHGEPSGAVQRLDVAVLDFAFACWRAGAAGVVAVSDLPELVIAGLPPPRGATLRPSIRRAVRRLNEPAAVAECRHRVCGKPAGTALLRDLSRHLLARHRAASFVVSTARRNQQGDRHQMLHAGSVPR